MSSQSLLALDCLWGAIATAVSSTVFQASSARDDVKEKELVG